MIVFLNGRFVPEEQALVSVFDRCFLYGDGLFETILIFNGKSFRWPAHLERLQRGADFLKIQLPFSPDELLSVANQLLRENQATHSLLRITLSRGIGIRGYSPKGAQKPSLIMSLHPAQAPAEKPPQWKVLISSFRLPANEPLAQFKTCNKLPQIMARAQADATEANEALLLNTDGFAVEGSSSNLFWIKENSVRTPPLAAGILPGVTRFVISELCKTLQVPLREATIDPQELPSTEGVFFSLTSQGIAEAVSVDGVKLSQSDLTKKLWAAYWDLVRHECGEQP